jgi:hypothetical protein
MACPCFGFATVSGDVHEHAAEAIAVLAKIVDPHVLVAIGIGEHHLQGKIGRAARRLARQREEFLKRGIRDRLVRFAVCARDADDRIVLRGGPRGHGRGADGEDGG